MVKEWYLLLKRYIEAESILITLDNYRNETRQEIMSSHFSSYDEEIEQYTSVSAENTAIRLVSLDDSINKAKQRYIKRINVLNKALDMLNHEELAAFERVAWGMDSYVPKRYEQPAIKKVCRFIEAYEYDKEQQAKAEELKETRRKAALLKQSLSI